MSEILNNWNEYFKRFTNPFLGTLLTVWIIRNFTFIFSLFNFDDNATRLDKVKYIRNYFATYDIFHEIAINIGITFIIMIGTFVCLAFARLLTNLYGKLIDYINSKSKENSVVSIEKHNALLKHFGRIKVERDSLSTEAQAHDETVKTLKKELLENEKNYINQSDQLQKELKKTNELTQDVTNKNKRIEQLENNANKLISSLTDANRTILIYDSVKPRNKINIYNYFKIFENENGLSLKISQDVKSAIENLIESMLIKEFIDLYEYCTTTKVRDRDYNTMNLASHFASMGLFTNIKDDHEETFGKRYDVTNVGTIVYNFFLNYYDGLEP